MSHYDKMSKSELIEIIRDREKQCSSVYELAEEELRKSNQRLDLLAQTASQLLKSYSPQDMVDYLCRKVLAFLNCDAFFNYLVDEEKQRLHLNACGGIPE
jgi:nitrate/nitrite-specific signal transduction histidine kinase